MTHRTQGAAAALTALAVVACSAQKPVIYPNQRARLVTQEQIDADVEECTAFGKEVAKGGGESQAAGVAKDAAVGGTVGAAGGAVGGAIYGSAGRGAAAGAATGVTTSLIWRLFRPRPPNPVMVNATNRCLHEKGYEVAGWQ